MAQPDYRGGPVGTPSQQQQQPPSSSSTPDWREARSGRSPMRARPTESSPLLTNFEQWSEDEGWNASTEYSREGARGLDGSPRDKTYYLNAFRTRLRYYVPIIGWLPKYKIEYLQYDVLAGMTVACLLVPQGLSYAKALVRIPPIHGLYTACVPLLIYGILGTSRQLGVGPEALISILVGATIKEYAMAKDIKGNNGLTGVDDDQSIAENVAIATMLNLLVGIFTFLLGFFRLGFLDSVLSRALLRGFVLAVAVVVMIDMSDTLLGIIPPLNQCGSTVPAPSEPGMEESMSPIQKLLDTLSNLHKTHFLTAMLSFVSISFLLGMKTLKKRYSTVRWVQFVPEILVLVVTSTLLSQIFRWDCQGVAILNRVHGNVSSKYDYPKLPHITLAKVKFLMLSAILISVIGFVESIVVAKTYATKHRYAASPNRELVALGTANIVGSMFGAYPAFGSLGRSAVNDTAGAKTQLAGFITGVVVLCTIIWLLPFFEFLPTAVCAGIIVVAALKLVELEDVYFILRLRAWKDMGLLLMTFLTTIFVSIESGTLLSVGVSLLLVIKHTTKTRLAILGRTLVVDPHTGHVKTKFRSLHDSGHVERIEGGLVIRIEEGLFFGNSGQLKDRLKRIEMYGDLGVHPGEEPRTKPVTVGSGLGATSPSFGGSMADVGEDSRHADSGHIKSVIFDFGAVTNIDASATQILLEIVEDYHHRNIEVCFVKVRENCKLKFLRAGIYDLVGADHFFAKIRDAISFLRTRNRIHEPPVFGPGSQSAVVPRRRGSFDSSLFEPSYQESFDAGIGSEALMRLESGRGGGMREGEGGGSRDGSPVDGGRGTGSGGQGSGTSNSHLRVPRHPRSRRRRRDDDDGDEGDVLDLFSDSEFEPDGGNQSGFESATPMAGEIDLEERRQ